MLCTSCSACVKPIVAVDIDGTLGNYHAHFLGFAAAYLAVPGYRLAAALQYDGTMPFRDWFCSRFSCDVTTFRAVKLAYRQGGQKRVMPVYPFARELVRELHKAGAEVWLTTTRPWQRYDRIDPDTHAWLDRNKIFGWSAVLYDEDKYELLHEQVGSDRVVGVLDDEPEQWDRASEFFGGVILRSSYYNRNVRRPIMAAGLVEACQMLAGHVTQWRRKHDR